VSPRRRRAADADDLPSGNLRRKATWAGLRRGDAVEVIGTRLRSAKWEFIAHVSNVATGDEWIEVVGGRMGDHKLRSFSPERVFAPTRKGTRTAPRSSLAEAPRLPLT
jgi:hypothetical protein